VEIRLDFAADSANKGGASAANVTKFPAYYPAFARPSVALWT